MKVFYSWQSDTPNSIGRAFLRDCLDKAIAGLEVAESDRPTVDQDTQGVLGAPVIADKIFEKIRDAKVVVADVTLTGQTSEGKRLANSNVAIELGYALGVHGDTVLLKIMNVHYGPPQDLPFDLAHRRWPVQFKLAPDASSEERGKVRDALVRELRGIFQLYVDANRSPRELFVPTPSTVNPAAYWQKDEALVSEDSRGPPLGYSVSQPLVYLRIWPREKIPAPGFEVLSDYSKTSVEPLCGRTSSSGWSNFRNRFGTVAYSMNGTDLAATTQILKGGEIWGVNQWLLRPRNEFGKIVPMVAYEGGMRESLRRYLATARSYLGYPPIIEVETGLVNVAEFRIAFDQAYNDGIRGPIYEDVRLAATVNMDEPETINAALLKVFTAVFEAAGVSRPENYGNFPPKPA